MDLHKGGELPIYVTGKSVGAAVCAALTTTSSEDAEHDIEHPYRQAIGLAA